jgi:hypothetical protein
MTVADLMATLRDQGDNWYVNRKPILLKNKFRTEQKLMNC